MAFSARLLSFDSVLLKFTFAGLLATGGREGGRGRGREGGRGRGREGERECVCVCVCHDSQIRTEIVLK